MNSPRALGTSQECRTPGLCRRVCEFIYSYLLDVRGLADPSECPNLLHSGLMVTLHRGSNYYFEMSRMGSLCSSREMIKKHVRNKANSHFQKVMRVQRKACWLWWGGAFFKPRSVTTPESTGRIALMMLGTSEMDSPASNCVRYDS